MPVKTLPIRSNNKAAHPITDTDLSLLQISAEDMLAELRNNPDLRHVRQASFSAIDHDNNSEIQVHVLVTRDQGDFLEPFQTEHMS